MKQPINEIRRMQELAGLIKENEMINNDTDFPNMNWKAISISAPEQDENGMTWVEMTDEKGDSSFLDLKSIQVAANGKENFVIDGDNQTYSITPEEAKSLLSKM